MSPTATESTSQPACRRRSILDLDCELSLPLPFPLDYTVLDTPTTIQARLIGPEDGDVILVMGGISAHRHAADWTGASSHANSHQVGWLNSLVGYDALLSPERFRILTVDFLPNDAHGAGYRVSPADQARVAQFACDYFGISTLTAWLGYSYGGMVGLHFARLFPDRLQQLIVASAAHRPCPMGSAWRTVQRQIIQLGLSTGQAGEGFKIARALGMTTYRTPEEFSQRFTSLQDIEQYLENRGRAITQKMSAERYLRLSESIDLHTIAPETISTPVALLGFRQDQLVPPADMAELRDRLPHVSHFFETDSLYGHDGFLKETDWVTQALRQILNH